MSLDRARTVKQDLTNPLPSEAWGTVRKWLASYAWEEQTFGKYQDGVSLDGVMTAGEARKLIEMFKIGPVPPTSSDLGSLRT